MALTLNLAIFFLIMLVEMTLEAIFWNTKGFSSLEGGDILDISALCVLQHCTRSKINGVLLQLRPAIPASRRLMQVDEKFEGILGFTVKPCLKTPKTKARQKQKQQPTKQLTISHINLIF